MFPGREAHEAMVVTARGLLAMLPAMAFVLAHGACSNAQEPVRTSPGGSPGMAVHVDPAFEVSTVKPSRSGGNYPSIDTHLHTFSATNVSVRDLMKWCYRLPEEDILGGPSWMSEMKFDLAGEPNVEGQASREQYRRMVQKLLAERFHLVLHETQQVSSVYALTLGEGQRRMQPSVPPDGAVSIDSKRLENGNTTVRFRFATMADFTYALMNSIAERQIVDETGLKGEYDFSLVLASAALGDDADAGEVDAALFKAVRSIGLELRARKEEVRMVVIDRIEKPTAN